MSGIQFIGKIAYYTLTAMDQQGNPIPNYQFNLKLAIMDKTDRINELYEVNDYQYQGSNVHPSIHQLIDVTPSHIGLTDSSGKVTVKVEYMPSDAALGYPSGAFDDEDGCFPIWYDATGNQIGHSNTKTQLPPILVE